MIEYDKNRIYPNSTPEFRILQKNDETMEMQVRYINRAMGYLGQWMPVQVEKEQNDTSSCSQA